MSLTLGVVALCLIAGGWLLSRAWVELSWRRDEREAEIRLRCVLAAQLARELAEDAMVDAFGRTLSEIRDLPVANPWDVAL